MNNHWWNESLAYSANTDVGMRRSNNQDAYLVELASTLRLWNTKGHLFIVADGMGAHAAGERASSLATKVVSQSYLKRTNETQPEALRNAILEAHATIKKQGEIDPSFENMGTTCDSLVLLPDRAYIGHVGDSRVYRLRDNVVEQMTFDHSLDWEVKYKSCSAENSVCRQISHVPKNIITRSLGPTEKLIVDVEGPFKTKPGDAFLLCSDGLSGQVADHEIGQILKIFQPEDATESLINLANLRGGPDNVTVVIARVKTAQKSEDIEQEIKKSAKIYENRPPLNAAAISSLIAAFVFGMLAAALFLIELLDKKTVTPDVTTWLLCGSAALFLVSVGLFLYFGRATLFRRPEAANLTFGSAPYTRASALPTAEFNANIFAVCDELCIVLNNDEQGEKIAFKPDWKGINEARRRADADAKAGDYASSIRANLSVVNYIMREYKKNSPQKKK